MADVRAYPGVPPLAAFAGPASASLSTPIILNSVTGDLYVVVAGVVTKIVTAGAVGLWAP